VADILGVVNNSTSVRVGKNYEGLDVVELSFTYDFNHKQSQTTKVVIDKKTAYMLAASLIVELKEREL